MDAPNLALLDDYQPAELDPEVWSANLNALRSELPELAECVADVRLPEYWRSAIAVDGSSTFRTEQGDAPPRWLAGSAAPVTRARGLVQNAAIAGKNPALPTFGAGALLVELLARLGPQTAVFVFESDAAQLAAVLRLVDLSAAISGGRAVLIPPTGELDCARALLERHPGLNPPAALVPIPDFDGQRIRQVQSICETLAGEVQRRRAARLTELRERSDCEAGEGLAVLSFGARSIDHTLSVELAREAKRLGWRAAHHGGVGPRHVHILPVCEAVAAAPPEVALCIGSPPDPFPIRPAKTICHWHHDPVRVPERLSDEASIHLAATPRIARALRSAGADDSRVVDFHWACSESDRELEPLSPTSGHVALLGDLPDASATACQIAQPTHRILWAQLHKTAAKSLNSATIGQPETLLREAQRASGVKVTERSLRDRLLRIIEHVLIPAVALEAVAHWVTESSLDVWAVGRGWDRLSDARIRLWADRTDAIKSPVDAPPLAAVVAAPIDPLSRNLLDAAVRGWPLLVFQPGRMKLGAALGGMFQPDQHYCPFSGKSELVAGLEEIRSQSDTIERRRTRTRAHLMQEHSYAARLRALAERLGAKSLHTIA